MTEHKEILALIEVRPDMNEFRSAAHLDMDSPRADGVSTNRAFPRIATDGNRQPLEV